MMVDDACVHTRVLTVIGDDLERLRGSQTTNALEQQQATRRTAHRRCGLTGVRVASTFEREGRQAQGPGEAQGGK